MFVNASFDKGMLARIQSSTEESTEATCMSGTGNLGRKRVEWRRNANTTIGHFPKNIVLKG